MTEPRTSLQADFERARRDALPVIALRRHPDGSMDDVVVENVQMFRAEQMDDTGLWMACNFANGEQVSFYVSIRDGVLHYDVGAMPDRWIDWDRRQRRESPVERDGDDRA